jgi:hypothetical protein
MNKNRGTYEQHYSLVNKNSSKCTDTVPNNKIKYITLARERTVVAPPKECPATVAPASRSSLSLNSGRLTPDPSVSLPVGGHNILLQAVLDLDLDWIRIQSEQWIRIWIPDPAPGEQK